MPNSMQQISIIYSKQTTELKEKTIQKRKNKQTTTTIGPCVMCITVVGVFVGTLSRLVVFIWTPPDRSQLLTFSCLIKLCVTLQDYFVVVVFCLPSTDQLNTCFDVIARFLVSDICNVCLRWFLLSIKGITLKANLREHALRYLNVTFNLKVRFNFLSLWALLQNKAHSINRIQRIMSFKGNYG